MKQLLLRVDDELHARLTAQAKARGSSVNALANQILSLGIDPADFSRKDRLKLRLMEIGSVGRERQRASHPSTSAQGTSAIERAIESMQGAGPLADDLLSWERDR